VVPFFWDNLLVDHLSTARRRMVELQLRSRGLRDERVLAAMAKVPRDQFASLESQSQAYEDHPLPIGEGQTISQPYIVGLTLEALSIAPSDIVLEIGTGSGYQAALLAELASHVYSIERHESLSRKAAKHLESLGYKNVTLSVGDGSRGLAQRAPFEAIVVAAAAPRIPLPLVEQLPDGGRMVIPVGPAGRQDLQLVRKQGGQALVTSLGGCAFVPLIGVEGQMPG
jgi:protein-L-isoaspartate(D-aspartate) O-methyltransferase